MTNSYSSNDDQADASTRVLRTQSDGSSATDTMSEVKDTVTEKAGEVVDKVKQQASTQIDSQKGRVSETLGSVALAVRQTGTQLQGQDQANIAQYTDKAAEQIERLSTYLRDADLRQITSEIERFARRQPALFLGGALALGLFGARFLKSSAKQDQQDWQGYPGYPGYSGAIGDYSSPTDTGADVAPYIDRSQGANYQGEGSTTNDGSSSDESNVRQRTWTGSSLEES